MQANGFSHDDETDAKVGPATPNANNIANDYVYNNAVDKEHGELLVGLWFTQV